MPKSKRNKVVHLTQVKKKSKDHKDDLIRQLTELVEKYEFVYVFDFDKTKSDRIMNLRLKMKEYGRIFAGRNSLVGQALNSIGEKTNTDYDKFLQHVKGHRGLLFTSIGLNEMLAMLEDGLGEFREKLLGYAQLRTPDDDTVGQLDSDGEEMDEDNEEEEEADDGDDAETEPTRRCVSFKPIKKSRRSKSKPTGSN